MTTRDRWADAGFYGLERRWFEPDYLFRVCVVDATVFGARVGGAWSGLIQKALLLGEFAFLIRSTVKPDSTLEAQYRDLDPRDDAFLRRDRRNFKLPASRVERVHVRQRRPRRGPVRTTMHFHLRDGGGRRALELFQSDADRALALLERNAFRVVR